jgi:hypothetical protein
MADDAARAIETRTARLNLAAAGATVLPGQSHRDLHAPAGVSGSLPHRGRSGSPGAPAGHCRRSGSGAPGGDAEPVAVRVHEVAFPSGEAIFIDGDPELL